MKVLDVRVDERFTEIPGRREARGAGLRTHASRKWPFALTASSANVTDARERRPYRIGKRGWMSCAGRPRVMQVEGIGVTSSYLTMGVSAVLA